MGGEYKPTGPPSHVPQLLAHLGHLPTWAPKASLGAAAKWRLCQVNTPLQGQQRRSTDCGGRSSCLGVSTASMTWTQAQRVSPPGTGSSEAGPHPQGPAEQPGKAGTPASDESHKWHKGLHAWRCGSRKGARPGPDRRPRAPVQKNRRAGPAGRGSLCGQFLACPRRLHCRALERWAGSQDVS